MNALVYLLTRKQRCEMPHCDHRRANGSRYCPPHSHEARSHGLRWRQAAKARRPR